MPIVPNAEIGDDAFDILIARIDIGFYRLIMELFSPIFRTVEAVGPVDFSCLSYAWFENVRHPGIDC